MKRGGLDYRIVLIAVIIIGFMVLYYSYYINGSNIENGESVKDILEGMSLEEKVGQVILAYFSGPEFSSTPARELREFPLGGVILFSDAGNIESPGQVADLTEAIQRAAVDNGVVPLFIAVDQEGGNVARLTEGVTVFPGNMALGATGSEELSRQSAAVIAWELRTLGINFNFAPVVDVNSNAHNPVIGVRSFGSDPHAVARLGRAMVEPYRREKVIATAKHFPGHGNTDVDSHYGLPLIPGDLSRLAELELLPFQEMIDAGIPAVMMAHILAPGLTGSKELPASLSPEAVSYLREEMGFQGLVVSDSLSMGAISERWGLEEAAVEAFRAGVDLILFGPWIGTSPGDGKKIFSALLGALEEGTITTERLDQSVERIIAVKKKYGLLADPWPRRDQLSRLAGPENREVARQIARESITLVRDRLPVIPLPAGEMVPLIWPAELEGSLAPLVEGCPDLQPYLLPFDATAAEIGEMRESLHEYPTVMVGASNLKNYPVWIELIDALTVDKRVALLALSSPYDLLEVSDIDTYLCTYSDSSVSLQALAGVLNGSLAPLGRLPVHLHLFQFAVVPYGGDLFHCLLRRGKHQVEVDRLETGVQDQFKRALQNGCGVTPSKQFQEAVVKALSTQAGQYDTVTAQ